ncbi:MAG: hypothetical protein Q7J54_04440 [Candidatus Woesearchaeota archaeon]|nr:hypothetical protein [Candidatus Woesearchaeota archaeon]
MKINNKAPKRKMPVSYILIVVWMFIAAISLLFKQFNLERLEANMALLGDTVALVNYFADFLILFAFITFIFLLFFRIRNTWKFFICFIAFLVIGELIGVLYTIASVDKVAQVFNDTLPFTISPSMFIVFGMISFLLHLLFYFIVAFFVYKNRSYFKNETKN